MKWHFLSSIVFVMVLTVQAISENRNLRIILLVPNLILFYTTLILFGLDYDHKKKEISKKHNN